MMEELKRQFLECKEKVLIFTKEDCPFCKAAIDHMQNLGIEPTLEVIDNNIKIETIEALHNICDKNKQLPR